MIITITIQTAKLICKNMKSANVPIDEQQVYFDFVNSLSHQIWLEEAKSSTKRSDTDDKGKLD